MIPKRRITASIALAAALAGCAPESAGAQGEEVKALYDIFLGVAAVVFVVVSGLIGWSIFRFRGREDDLPPQTKHNVKLELTWFAIPTVIVVVLFAMSVGVLDRVNEEHPAPDVSVTVEGFQWGWRFSYQESGVELTSLPQQPTEVVLPTGRPIAFFLTSPDVIHAFQIPKFLMKRDVVPGRTNRMDVTIEKEGTYDGACAEFCGLKHDAMTFSIRAVSPEEYERWILEQEEAL